MRIVRVCYAALVLALCCMGLNSSLRAQTVTAELSGQVTDSSGGVVAKATVTALNTATGLSRTVQTSDGGHYYFSALPVGTYRIDVEHSGFNKSEQEITLQVNQVAELDFSLTVGATESKVVVTATSEVIEPTRTQVSTVVTESQINDLPTNGREFIDFALLAPGVQVGDTTSGSTDVIVEPVTKLSFAGQNIHFNFIAVDGADDISTASGIQRGTPPQESVQEFRVVNTDYTVQFGRAVGGIVNIITRSGTNDWHGSLYEYAQNSAFDAINLLAAPHFHQLSQNQYGAAIGGPIQKDATFIYANYEGQRRDESPTYNSAVLNNIAAINAVKVNVFKLPPENLSVLRDANFDDGFIRLDHSFGQKNYLYIRYFINDDRLTNQSPLNNGFDLPSAFKNNYIRDQSVAGALTTNISPSWINELRMQYANRRFDFPVVSTQPHLEVSNVFAVGVNRGNPDIYTENRFEVVDNVTRNWGPHTFSFGGDFNRVGTYESFPLFYPFEADFANLPAFLGTDGAAGCPVGVSCPDPFVIFFQRFSTTTTPEFTEPSILGGTAVYQGGPISQQVRDQSSATLDHYYTGFYGQDKWRATKRLTLNLGLRWEFENWPSGVLNTQWKNFDPRVGLAYNIGTSRNVVFRGGFGLFHGIFPSPLLMCQEPSCGGLSKYPDRPFENSLNAKTGLFTFASSPFINYLGLNALLTQGTYPNGTPESFCPDGTLASCGFLQDATIVRFDQGSKTPYGIQASASIEFQPFKDALMSISGIHLRGVHLGSFFNVNQPDPSGTVKVFTSSGASGCKNVYYDFSSPENPAGPVTPTDCSAYPASYVIPGVPHVGGVPGFRDDQYSVFFEATSRWDSVYDGLLVNFNKRLTHNFAVEFSYTFAHSIDDGPNPSFVLIPQDSNNLREERANSADDVRHRFVGNATVSSPKTWNVAVRDFEFSTILTVQSPQWFTKYAGFDVNGDVFGNNDRVGFEPRNTYEGDKLATLDVRLARTFPIHERYNLQLLIDAFNVTNTVNVRYYNTNYGAADFCPDDPIAPGCAGATAFYKEGSPNPLYGTPSAVLNPRQLQFAAKLNF
jgi:Carboxypeptidase regulatory-like domain/TonB dependent receptor